MQVDANARGQRARGLRASWGRARFRHSFVTSVVLALALGAGACGDGGDALTGEDPADARIDADRSRATTTTVAASTSTAPPTTAPPTTAAPTDTAGAAASPGPGPATTAAPAPPPPPARPPAAGPPAGITGGWLVTVYFTPRESNYGGESTAIHGCPAGYCPPGQEQALGSYPTAFLDRMRIQGSGLLTSGTFAGKYLNWSSGVGGTGYWIEDVPKSASGNALVGRQSAASPSLPYGANFRIADCGRNAFGGPLNDATCAELKNPTWRIIDRFEPYAAQGDHHIDLYLGVERPGETFASSPLYVSWSDVVIARL
jgi:hypothetical protein